MEEDFKHMVRIARKDINGNKTIVNALTDHSALLIFTGVVSVCE